MLLFCTRLVLATKERETGTLVWEAITEWCAFGSGHLASRYTEVCWPWKQWAGPRKQKSVRYCLSSSRGTVHGAAVWDEHASNFILSLSRRGMRESWQSETEPRDAGFHRQSSAEESSEVSEVFLSRESVYKVRTRADRGVQVVVGRSPRADGCVRSYMTFWNSWRDLMMLSS